MMPAGVRYAPFGFFLSVFLSLAPQIGPPVAAQTAGVATERATKRENLEIPTGTILPVRLNQGLSWLRALRGQTLIQSHRENGSGGNFEILTLRGAFSRDASSLRGDGRTDLRR